jgi:hypothetical protein
MNDLPVITEDEAKDILAVGDALGVIGGLFRGGEGTLEGLRMVVAQLRVAANVLEAVGERWEESS